MGKNQLVYKMAWFQLETTINCIIVSSTLLLAIPLYTMHHFDLLQGNRVLTPTPTSNNSSIYNLRADFRGERNCRQLEDWLYSKFGSKSKNWSSSIFLEQRLEVMVNFQTWWRKSWTWYMNVLHLASSPPLSCTERFRSTYSKQVAI